MDSSSAGPSRFANEGQTTAGGGIGLHGDLSPGWAAPGDHPQGWSGAGSPGDTPPHLVVFGDLLSDDGNTAAVEQALGATPDYLTAPYSPTGDFSDGPKWTSDLARDLGLQQQNFAYEGATAGTLGDAFSPVNPAGGLSSLDTFAGQIQQFAQAGGTFSPDDVVSVTFGGNDIFLASADQLAGNGSAAQIITDSVNAEITGLEQLAALGAKHFLVSNSPDVTLAPIFQTAEFQASGATVSGVQALVAEYNTQLASALTGLQKSTGLDVKTLDLDKLFGSIVADPSHFGFTNVTQPVLTSLPGTNSALVYNPAINGQDPAVEHGSLFIDPLFDTTERAQMLIAGIARGALF